MLLKKLPELFKKAGTRKIHLSQLCIRQLGLNRKLFYNINLNITTFNFVIEGKADSQGYKFLYKEVFSYAISLI